MSAGHLYAMHLLIADPDPTVRLRLKRAAGERGGTFTFAEAAAWIELHPLCTAQMPDIAIVAEALPGFAPGEIATLRRQFSALSILVVGGEEPERLRSVLKEGAAGYLWRGDAPDMLAQALETVRGGGIYIPPLLGLRAGRERLMTSAGPVPAGFFREDAVDHLTPRQRVVLAMIRDRWSNNDIADSLGISIGTVKIHITAVFKALGVRNRTQAMVAAERMELPDPGPRPAS
ncbi:LuxR C-terminal-related transcriptional regulator [Rhodocista pekingensis]|uniref:LuxR C-terminal-related transcriptional regulator n=1 Tax=Rhodocista pekingensis TaxID=201185 RepID=A0ABW2KSL8_9PROT